MSLRDRVENWLGQRALLRSVSILAGGTALSQALALLFMPVLTRLYPVAEFGYFQMYLSILTAASMVAALRYELAVLLPSDTETAANVRCVALLSVGVATIGVAAVIALIKIAGFSSRIAGRFAPWLWLLPLGILAAGVLQVETYWGLRMKSFRHLAQSKFTQVGSQLVVQAGVGSVAPVASGLMGGDILGRLFSTVVLVISNWKQTAAALGAVNWKSMRAAARRYKEFPLVSSASGLLNTAGFTVPPLLIGWLYGVHVLGLFAAVERITGAPTLLVGQAVFQLYMSEGARLAQGAPGELERLFSRTFRKLLLFTMVPAVLVVLLAPWGFAFALGPQWHEAGVYARLVVARQIIAFAVWPLSSTLLILERQRLQLVWDASRALVTISTIAGCAWLGASPRVMMFCYATAMAAGYFAYWAMCRKVLKSHARQHATAAELPALAAVAAERSW